MVKLASVSSSREDLERDQDNPPRAKTLAEALDDQPRLAQVLYWLGRVHYARGQLATAADYAEQSLAIADALGAEALAAPSTNLLGRHYTVQGNVVRGSEMLARSVEQMHQIGNIAEEATAAGFAGFACAWKGDFAQSFAFADRGLALTQQLEDPFAEAAELLTKSRACKLLVHSWCKLDVVDDQEAERTILEAIQIQEDFGAEPELARSYLTYARLLRRQGETNKAKEYDDQAIDMFRRMGMAWDLGQAELLHDD